MTVSDTGIVTNLNADMLDGDHATAFATAGHTHTTFASLTVGSVTNYTQIDTDGDITQYGTARRDWTKHTASSITLTAGSGTGTVANLQTHADGSFYKVDEVAAAPGIDLIIDFADVKAFNWVQIIASYWGSSSHALAVQLWDWVGGAWKTFNAIQTGAGDVTTAGGNILDDFSFVVPSDTIYIGTGGDAGKVRVRFYHTMAGNNSHDLYVDVVALYQ